jgi:hypothetical protein
MTNYMPLLDVAELPTALRLVHVQDPDEISNGQQQQASPVLQTSDPASSRSSSVTELSCGLSGLPAMELKADTTLAAGVKRMLVPITGVHEEIRKRVTHTARYLAKLCHLCRVVSKNKSTAIVCLSAWACRCIVKGCHKLRFLTLDLTAKNRVGPARLFCLVARCGNILGL